MQQFDSSDDLLTTLLKPSGDRRETTRPAGLSSRAKAEAARVAALKALRHWGHMRCSELARVVYPHASHGEQLAQRLMQRLTERGEAVPRRNALGTRSYVLSRGGAAALDAMGWDAKHGLELSSVAGGTFLHRSLATRYGVEQELRGFTAYGEHAIAQGFAP
ncbi:MAG: hypothetical protein JO370_05340, partial [Paucibacter sp.]|nr:hypothetical protein [Roseateles sp.]